MHEGHRKRLRSKFVKSQTLSDFEEHQTLELLLFYAIPQKDTNTIAHKLISKFGSLSNVFDADITDIASVDGMGEYSASLIKLVPEISRKYWISKNISQEKILGVQDAANYSIALLKGKPYEELYVICLDKSFGVKYTQSISNSSVDTISISVREVAEIAIRSASASILLAHNHPGGNAIPSDEDIVLTMKINDALSLLGIILTDHIVVSEEDFFSFTIQKMLNADFPIEEIKAAQYASPLYKIKKQLI